MARNGAGAYSLPEAAFVYNTVISETAMNSNLSDIASALTASIAKDGQTTPTADLPMGGYNHTGVDDADARDQYAAAGQVQDGAFIWCGTAGGTADAITLTPSPAITAYATGMEFRWKASSSANTGAATVAISGLAAKALEINDSALSAGDHAANKYYRGIYDGTAFQIEQISAGGGSAASTSSAGIVELATTAETTTGTDATRAVTPDGLHDMTSLSGAAWFLDEDDMSSDSATKVASQQSIKAYVDGAVTTPGLVPISTQAASNDASVSVTSGISSTYDVYEWHLINVIPATDAVHGELTVYTSGPTEETGATDYEYTVADARSSTGGFSTSQSTGATAIKLDNDTLGSASMESVSGKVTLYAPADGATAYCKVKWSLTVDHADGTTGNIIGAARFEQGSAVIGLGFAFSSGNVESGDFHLYGITIPS